MNDDSLKTDIRHMRVTVYMPWTYTETLEARRHRTAAGVLSKVQQS